MKIKTGDTVVVISGDDKGKTGKVLKVFPKDHKVMVEGINVNKKHVKPTQANPKGSIVDKAMPIDISNVAFATKDGKATKIGYKMVGDKKVRFEKKSGTVIK
ncbi:MAG: 50S ribosomal protein L24 [Bacilli bacterium]|jgi:large subunit ribosomal protein L24|nr:50S ribosomal protein L24 [Bacilli bacterium]